MRSAKIFVNSFLKFIILLGFPARRRWRHLLDQFELDDTLNALKFCGTNVKMERQFKILNPQYISVGHNFSALYNLRIEAWDRYLNQQFTPEVVIGNNVVMNTDVHIGCINKIIIGDNVLIASRVYISDHSHGEINYQSLIAPPLNRALISKGPVIIGDNVWIGEGACILPGVSVGNNCIIGANSVVTKDIPMNAVVAGVPSRILRILTDDTSLI